MLHDHAMRVTKGDRHLADEVTSRVMLDYIEAHGSKRPEAAMTNYWRAAVRKKYIDLRREQTRTEQLDGMELLTASPARQYLATVLGDVLRGVEALHPRTQAALLLLAAGHSPREASEQIGISVGRIHQRVAEARRLLKAGGYWDDEADRRQFIGIRRDSNKWEAYIRIGGKQKHLGMFETATRAAMAYDRAAREAGRTKLNFPGEKVA